MLLVEVLRIEMSRVAARCALRLNARPSFQGLLLGLAMGLASSADPKESTQIEIWTFHEGKQLVFSAHSLEHVSSLTCEPLFLVG
jgi:hypothetical protein